MVSLRLLLGSLAVLSTSALARVTNITVSDTVKAGENLTAVLEVTSYIQNWEDFGVIWGLKLADQNGSVVEAIGAELSYDNLYPTTAEDLGNVTVSVPIPEGQDGGEYILTAAIPYLVGASGSTGIRYFNQTLTVTK